jgi:hypothetical protein
MGDQSKEREIGGGGGNGKREKKYFTKKGIKMRNGILEEEKVMEYRKD